MLNKMINQIALKINEHTEYERDVLEFGLKAIFSNFLCIGTAMIIAVILNTFTFTLLFIICLTPLKIIVDSFHCKKMKNCILFYNLLIVLNALIYKIVTVPSYLLLLIYPFGIMYLFNLDDTNLLRKQLGIYFCLFVLFYVFNCNEVIWIFSLALGNVVFLVKLQKIMNR